MNTGVTPLTEFVGNFTVLSAIALSGAAGRHAPLATAGADGDGDGLQ